MPLRRITFQNVESYVETCKAKHNAVATVTKKLKYLRAAFNKAIRRGYLAKSPMVGWKWEKPEERHPHRDRG